MRLITFGTPEQPRYGALTDGGVVDLTATVGKQYASLRAILEQDALAKVRTSIDKATAFVDPGEIDLLPVIPDPGKFFCIGLNYDSHRKETGRAKSEYPTVFTRFTDTLVGHGQPIVKPRVSDCLDYEGELAAIIGRPGRHIPRDQAMAHVAGYCCFNDASVRDFQKHSTQITPGKNFPATGSLGPALVTADEIKDIHALSIRTTLNDEIVQDADTSMLIFDIPTLIAYISSFTPLSAGDVIATGTPGGVGVSRDPQLFMQPGDRVVVEIEGVGKLENVISSEG